ncbi:hypothetical protein FKM82_004146 [Ascaphus truei]
MLSKCGTHKHDMNIRRIFVLTAAFFFAYKCANCSEISLAIKTYAYRRPFQLTIVEKQTGGCHLLLFSLLTFSAELTMNIHQVIAMCSSFKCMHFSHLCTYSGE